jgi:pyruvate,water dikinase
MVRHHHTFSFLAEPTASLFYNQAREWTGLEIHQLLLLLDGASPISTGFSPEIEKLVLAIQDDEHARAILNSDDAPATQVDTLLELPDPVGKAMNRFILMDGHRLANSFDLQGECLFELPETITDRLKDALANGFVDRTKEAEEDAEYVRTLVPAKHIAEFDVLLADARQIARIKDERGLYNDIWAGGIMRKAILGAGRRLVDQGVISNPLNLIEATWTEIQMLLRGNPGATDAELIARGKARMSSAWRDAPEWIGMPPSPPVLPESLPPEVELMVKASGTVGAGMSTQVDPDSPDLTGQGANKGIHEGRARVAVGDYSFNQINRNDVLVTSNHSEAFNAVATRVGAIVTDTGGILSHLSIVSRELGIQCIVGCKNATTVIPDGAMVRVDGTTGIVTILD